MAKIKHNNFIDTVAEMLSVAKDNGTIHLYAQDHEFSGRTIQVDGRKLSHFATTSYLGLEHDLRLKQAAVTAVMKYGTQFPLSKTYISHPLYSELEHKVESMYGIPPIVTKNSTLGHLSAIPTMVRDEDAVIMDHQVHWSVQNACLLLKIRKIPVEIIRHNNMQMLEERIREHSGRCSKIWYMADGVYSMFGDYAPISDLLALCARYPQLHLYFDDVHGMSWRGKNGTGYVVDTIGPLPENVVVVGTLSKSFGASGAVLMTPDRALRERIRNFGGPLTFSAQLEPSSVGAAIASATIHLSEEIAVLQHDLAEKIRLFNALLSRSSLPMIARNDSPVFFLGTAKPATAYNLVQRLLREGFFVNPALYPAVPVKNTGVRMTVSANNLPEDIRALFNALEHHFPKALEETENSLEKVRHSFGLPSVQLLRDSPAIPRKALKVDCLRSIDGIDQMTWDGCLGKSANMDWQGMKFLQQAFHNPQDPANGWSFYYFLITDAKGAAVLLVSLTLSLWKDDMLAPESVSLQLEERRKTDPLYLTSKVLSMGSLFTEGDHWYLDQDHPLATEALAELLDQVEALSSTVGSDMVVLRDFDPSQKYFSQFHDHGFVKIDMPETSIVDCTGWNDIEGFAGSLSKRSRAHFRKEVLPFCDSFEVRVKHKLNKAEIAHAHELYANVSKNNLGLNLFEYPAEIFRQMSLHPQWEFILLYLRDDAAGHDRNRAAGILFCYRNSTGTYVPALVGMDYSVARKYNLYRQLLLQAILQGKRSGCNRIHLGITASFEKRKMGASVLPKVAFIQARDNFQMELLGVLQNGGDGKNN
ncbi:aminotransferase class I/II-fold pyridoxal phosphate-dependent enzyme [Flavobacterium macacae]|uniref:Aminotransferase class I/II-fold pyridoxal phosphate-dependent enzyme n=1 Tax=Flavobacterium macacae TaxID=2488993 RepID=A0A3P3W6G6_9FLAO|nr:aminotransferase class I/II-fold pyridoxal phosphate-dependent enzyme [Flavobacterium macacae]RRJ90765.1 aminotransferase class I/II-fold pyridoxal phosphate-dependent enzyme [Flavobacterium macacae]